MKLKEYLTEVGYMMDSREDIIAEIRRKADPSVLRTYRKTGQMLYRLSKYHSPYHGRTHKNRMPRDTWKTYHEWMDEWFKKEFGWRARSEHVLFCYIIDKRKTQTDIIKVLFPVKVEKVVWSYKISDITTEYLAKAFKLYFIDLQYKVDYPDLTKEVFMDGMDKLGYQSGSLEKAMSSGIHEIMVKTKEYYSIPLNETKIIQGILAK